MFIAFYRHAWVLIDFYWSLVRRSDRSKCLCMMFCKELQCVMVSDPNEENEGRRG